MPHNPIFCGPNEPPRKFVSSGQETRRSMALSLRQVTRQGSAGLTKSSAIAEEMGTSLADIETILSNAKNELPSNDHRKSVIKGDKDKKPGFSLFRKRLPFSLLDLRDLT